ncbi:hypothetical protein ACNNMT_09285 [Staphylococcus epidermidis]|uniref:hypothetical protein n=1 Tax=Staphylococcus epidermidis TaxID=1282 RepID=UPI003AADD1B7
MHQYKELIDGIDIKYIEMPDKLEYVILGSELYVNSRLSSSSYVKEDIKTYYVKSNKTNALISLNQIEKAINAHDCKTLQDLSNYFNLPTTHLFLTM